MEIEFPPKETCKLMYDNIAAISISKNPVQHDRIRHLKIDKQFIKEKLEARIICLPFFRSKDQLVDILTKALASKPFSKALASKA